jgi:sugar lactone lactonase YvrE
MKTMPKLITAMFAFAILTTGAITASAASGDLFVSINGTGENGAGSIYKYTAKGVQSTFATGLSEPRGVAFDSAGNLFVGNSAYDSVNQTFQGFIVKITPQGAKRLFVTLSGNFFVEGLAFGSAGNLFVAAQDFSDPNLASTIYEITPAGVISTFGSTPGQCFGLAFDSAGNLFAAGSDPTGGIIYKFTPDGTRSVFADSSAFSPDHGPQDFAFDRFGNLFVSENHDTAVLGGNERILKFIPNGMESEFATGLTEPRGLAFDRSRNLFVTDHVYTPPGDILKFAADGNETVFASGITTPEFLAFQGR